MHAMRDDSKSSLMPRRGCWRWPLAAVLYALGGCASTGQLSMSEFLDDAAVTTRVRARLVEDRMTAPLTIEVDTLAGVVQLKGDARTPAQRVQAEALARSTPGVKAVRNAMVIKP
jgi:hyperosmotically inducible periplasmic protein